MIRTNAYACTLLWLLRFARRRRSDSRRRGSIWRCSGGAGGRGPAGRTASTSTGTSVRSCRTTASVATDPTRRNAAPTCGSTRPRAPMRPCVVAGTLAVVPGQAGRQRDDPAGHARERALRMPPAPRTRRSAGADRRSSAAGLRRARNTSRTGRLSRRPVAGVAAGDRGRGRRQRHRPFMVRGCSAKVWRCRRRRTRRRSSIASR